MARTFLLTSNPAVGNWRSRLLRPALAVLALLLAFFGEKLAEDDRVAGLAAPPVLSWVLFGLAAIVLFVAARPVPRVVPAPPTPFLATLKQRRGGLLFVILLSLAILCSLASIPLFVQLNNGFGEAVPDWAANTESWLLYIASLLLFGLAFVVWERSAAPPTAATNAVGDALPRRVEWLLIAALFIVAALLRFVNLDNVPPGLWFDEAQNGIVARGLLEANAQHPTFIAADTQQGSLYFYIQGIILQFTGASVWAVRFLSALSGSLIVPLIYLLGARLFGWRAGLVAAVLLAVSSWNITFSRFGMTSLSTVALDVAIYLCMAQGLRTGRLGYFAGAGVLLGLALQGYYPSRLIPIVIVLLLLHLLITQRRRVFTLLRTAAPVFVAATLIAFLPVGLFALQRPADYNQRLSTVSIFGNPTFMEDLRVSLNDHALMFNFAGDRNGRHNLPAAPMLDPLTAALFLAGLGYCLLRAWRWQYFMPLIWFVAAMSGGVLSLVFEAPQAHRTLEASVVISLICGIFLGDVWRMLWPAREATPVLAQEPPPVVAVATIPRRVTAYNSSLLVRVPKSQPEAPAVVSDPPEAPNTETLPTDDRLGTNNPRITTPRFGPGVIISSLAILAIVGVAATLSLNHYFGVQVANRQVWEDMSSPQRRAAELLASYSASADIYPGQFYIGLNQTRLLAPTAQQQEWLGMQMLPLDSHGRDAIILMDTTQAKDLATIANIYPHATFEPLQAPSDPTPLMWTIYIPAADLISVQGVAASFSGAAEGQAKTLQKVELKTADWPVGESTALLRSTLKVSSYNQYNFAWQAPPDATTNLAIDGYPIARDQPVPLGIGLHTLVLTSTLANGTSASGDVSLLWNAAGSAPVPIPQAALFDPLKVQPHGLTATWRSGSDFLSPPAFVRIEPIVGTYYHHGPIDGPFSVEWSGKIFIPQGDEYEFSIYQINSSQLWIDGNLLIDNPSPQDKHEKITLTAGLHDLKLDFISSPGAIIYLYWQMPGRERAVIPAAFLWPQMGEYPEAGVIWPTLNQYNGMVLPADRLVNDIVVVAPPPAQPTPPPPPTVGPTAVDSSVGAVEITPQLITEVTIPPAANGAAEPRDVAVDSQGNFYVASNADGLIRKYDPNGTLVFTWGNNKGDNKVFTELFAIAIDGTDNILALDSGMGQILRFDTNGQPVGEPINSASYSPRGFSIAPNGDLLVADSGGAAIRRFNATGVAISTFGSVEASAGGIREPADVVANENDIFVYDTNNARIARFNADGSFAQQWSIATPTGARDAGHLALDTQGRLFVTLPSINTVAVYDRDGNAVARWQEQGLAPTGIFIDAQDNVYVTYPAAGIVRKYQLPK